MGTCLSKQNTTSTEIHRAQQRRPSSVFSIGGTGKNGTPNKNASSSSGFLQEIDDEEFVNGGSEPRIVSCEESISAVFGNVKVRYGWMSQRGYYPDDEHKPNQDKYCVRESFIKNPHDALFSVFDGHGREGDKCAQFAADHLPNLIARHMRKGQLEQRRKMIKHESMKSAPSNNNNDGGANTTSGGGDSGVIKAETIQLNKEMTQHACATAHKQCNLAMHGHPHVDDTLSGTTSITCYIHGDRNKVTVCNVGDSRAVLGKRMNRESYSASAVGNGDGKEKYYKALPLSRDQTPYRRDERKRIRKYGAGARILSLDQIEGLEPILADIDDDENDDAVYGKNDKELGKEIDEDGDPPRIWHPEQDYPGTAFTRSLGDAFAEELGVFAEPEMLTRELEEGDEIIVLASDGVFEFLTNQSVIDICAKFKDPLSACKAVIAESYELWLQYELRTDDITMICIFIESNEAKSSVKDTNEKDDLLMTLQRESKPVRLRPSVEKSQLLRELSKKTLFDDNNEVDISKLYTEKTEQEKEIIAQAIKSCVMLQSITDDQRETIYGVMEPVEVSKGDWIIRQGTVGDKWFIVESGTFEVRILQKNKDDPLNTGGTLVHEYQGALETHTHPSFGEHALLYSVPRAASIIAQTDGKLWALHKSAWRKVLVERSGRQDLIKILRTINVLKIFNLEEIEYIAGTMKIESFAKDYTITRTSMPGDALYIISNGQCARKKRNKGSKLVAGQYFGDEVFVSGCEQYTFDVKTTSRTSCWKLEKKLVITLREQYGDMH